MKKTIILILCTVFCACFCQAQSTQRQKAIHMAALRIADQIGVDPGQKEAFVAMYQDYKKESSAIMAVKPELSEDTEKASEQKILSNFEKSEKLLALRKAYYTRFRTLLSASQIQKMYDVERNAIQKP